MFPDGICCQGKFICFFGYSTLRLPAISEIKNNTMKM